MKNTKDKILATALDLFNRYGLPKVTLRSIAQEMGISQGNLNYHFKKRAEIVEGLYFQLVATMDKSISEITNQELSLALILDLQQFIMHNFYTYRFFLLDFVQIIREHETIKKHYLTLSKQREEQFMELATILIHKKIFREAILPNEYRFLYTRFQILGDFWISAATLTNETFNETLIDQHYEMIVQSIYPYLTAEGQRDYKVLIPS